MGWLANGGARKHVQPRQLTNSGMAGQPTIKWWGKYCPSLLTSLSFPFMGISYSFWGFPTSFRSSLLMWRFSTHIRWIFFSFFLYFSYSWFQEIFLFLILSHSPCHIHLWCPADFLYYGVVVTLVDFSSWEIATAPSVDWKKSWRNDIKLANQIFTYGFCKSFTLIQLVGELVICFCCFFIYI